MSATILYFGRDEVFLNSLRNTIIDTEISEDINLISMDFDKPDGSDLITQLVPEIISKEPNIIMIDFSFNTDKVILLARHLRLTLDPSVYSFIGLLNQASEEKEKSIDNPKDNVKLDFLNASLTQLPIIHYKGIDPKHILHNALYMYGGTKEFKQETAKFNNLKREFCAKYFSTVTHILEDSIIIETSLQFAKEQDVKVESTFLPLLHSRYLITGRSTKDLLQTKFSRRYRFNLTDGKEAEEVVIGAPAEEEQEEKKPELPRVDLEALKIYIQSLDKKGSTKKAKLLIVQDGLSVLSQLNQSLSDLPYFIRYQTGFRKKMKVVSNFRPNIIAIELHAPKKEEIVEEEVTTEEQDESLLPEQLDLNSVAELIQELSNIEGYTPFIKIFNCSTPTQEIRDKLQYPNILSSDDDMAISLLLGMCELFSKKRETLDATTNDPLITNEETPFNVYALNPISRVVFNIPIAITSISENEITFLSDQELPVRGVLNLDVGNAKFYITIAPQQDPPLQSIDDKHHYLGFINGVTTIDLQEIRQYVNSLFLEEKRLKEEEEKKAFAAANKEAASKKAEDNKEEDSSDSDKGPTS
jgi:hypothetical protein